MPDNHDLVPTGFDAIFGQEESKDFKAPEYKAPPPPQQKAPGGVPFGGFDAADALGYSIRVQQEQQRRRDREMDAREMGARDRERMAGRHNIRASGVLNDNAFRVRWEVLWEWSATRPSVGASSASTGRSDSSRSILIVDRILEIRSPSTRLTKR